MHKLEKLILESFGELLNEALSYAFSEYDFIIKDDAYKAEVEAKIKKELKKVQSEPLEIPEKDLEAIIKNAENYFAKEARKGEKANRNPRKIKSTEFAQFAADYYTEEYYPDKYGKDYPDKRGDMKAIQTGYTPAQAERFRRSDVVPFLIDYGVKGKDSKKTIGLYNMPDDYYTMDAKEFDKKYEVYQRREIKRRNDRLKDPDFPIEKLQDKPGGPLKLQKDFYEIRVWEFDKIYGKGGKIEDDDFDLEDYSFRGFLNEYVLGSRHGSLVMKFKDLEAAIERIASEGDFAVRRKSNPSDKVQHEWEIVPIGDVSSGEEKSGIRIYDYKFPFDPAKHKTDETHSFSVGGVNRMNTLSILKHLFGPEAKAAYSDVNMNDVDPDAWITSPYGQSVMEEKDDESFDLEKEFEDDPKLTKFKDLPADMQKKFSKEIKVFGKNAPGDPNRDYVDSDYETYYFTTSYNKETGSVGHRLVRLPSYSKLYNSFVKIIKDIKTLMGVDAVKNDAAAKEIFENIKTLFRQLQRYLRTNHPKQYDLMKMRRMAEGLKKAKTILEKLDYNDPVLIKSRVAKMRADDLKKLDAYKKSPEGRAAARAQASAERKEAKGRELVRKLKIKRAQVMRDMENDPDIEPTGGPVADMYGDELNKIDNAIEKAASLYNKNVNMSYDQAVGKINEFIGGDTEERISALFDKLVPGSGNADTVEGEIIRAINRIIYRWGNDGDRFWYGYGAETVGPPMEYLTDSTDIPLEIRNKFKAWENDNFGQDYNKKELEDLAQIALQYVEMKVREDDLSKNDDDIFNYGQKYIDHVRDMEDEEDEYDDYYDDEDEEDEDYYNEDKGEKISKSNMDGYKKGNISLAESLLDDIKEQEEPEPEEEGDEEAPKETVLEDATDQILSKFPTLKAAIIKLQTEDFKEFVDTIDWISPRPTEFRVNLKNGQEYILKWTGKTFEAQIMGKRYYIDKIDDYQQALDKLAILYKEGPMSGAGEGEAADAGGLGGDTGGGGGGDFPGDDAGGGGGGLGDDDAGGGLGDDAPADDAGGGADLTGEPVDFEEPAEDPAA